MSDRPKINPADLLLLQYFCQALRNDDFANNSASDFPLPGKLPMIKKQVGHLPSSGTTETASRGLVVLSPALLSSGFEYGRDEHLQQFS